MALGASRGSLARPTVATAVVGATCSGSFGAFLRQQLFEAVIVDEAAQASERAVLMPLLRTTARGIVVLFGDHMQLPPTVMCQDTVAEGSATSLFERLIDRGVSPILLEVQYRMHPRIAAFPAQHFYGGILRTGGAANALQPVPFPLSLGLCWPDPEAPVAFQGVYGVENCLGTSFYNEQEAALVVEALVSVLSAKELCGSDVGVITPYGAQVSVIRSLMDAKPELAGVSAGLAISSVDGFQGGERELILVSTVRANRLGSVGFLSDPRRLNVTLTRARRGLIVFGHAETLASDAAAWGPWLSWIADQGLAV